VRVSTNGHLASNEQDSIDDIASCVAISVLTPSGWREEEPEFGSREDFPLLPVNLADLQSRIARDEPRAQLDLRDDEHSHDELELRITARLTQIRGTV
jgi:hypothetical protein